MPTSNSERASLSIRRRRKTGAWRRPIWIARCEANDWFSKNTLGTKPCYAHVCESHNTPMVDADGKVIGVASFAKDITERKRAEEALRESEERFRQAMEATNDGLWDWNVKSGDVYYSPAYSRILGYEAAEFANRAESWTDLLHPDDRAEAISVNQACIENRIPHFEVEFRMRTKGGEWRTILGRGKAVCRDADGRAIRMIGTHVDITERKRAEEALQKAHDELEQRVEERTAELAKANEELAIFRKFAEASGQGFSMADLDGHLTLPESSIVSNAGRGEAGRSHRQALIHLLLRGIQSQRRRRRSSLP